MLYLFLFHIDYLCKPCFDKKTTLSNKSYRDIELVINCSHLYTFGSDSIFVKNVFHVR